MAFQKGKLNPNYTDGHTTIKKFCIDCKKPIKFSSIRCHQCNNRNIPPNNKGGKNKCKICNKQLTNYDAIYCNEHKMINRKKLQNYCIDCKEKIQRNSKRCLKCYKKFINGKNNPAYKTGFYCRNKKCIDCNKHCASGAIRCKSCNEHINKLGKKNPQYIDGKGHLPYNKNFPQIRIKILKRDSNTCQVCHKKGNQVHHIDYNQKNDDAHNLITLCIKCHTKTNTNRDYWYSYFTYIMEN